MPEDRSRGPVPNTHMAEPHLHERREKRYDVAIEIEVTGIDKRGEVFSERTVTLNVSEWGCRFALSVELNTNDFVALRVLGAGGAKSSQVPSMFQIVRVVQEDGTWIVGAWKMEPRNVWGVELAGMAEPDEGTRRERKAESDERSDDP